MAEHLVIGDLSALLIVLGFTGPLLAPLLRVRWLAPLRVFAHPLVALPAWMISFYVWHLPFMYQAALRHDLIHGLQHACFLGFGIAVWMALLGPLPKPAWFSNAARLAYIIVVRLAGTVLANVLIFSGTVLYPIYRAGDAKWHISPLGDQIAAAGVMMVEESLLTIGLFCWLFLKVAREGEERQRLIDYAAAEGIELDQAKAYPPAFVPLEVIHQRPVEVATHRDAFTDSPMHHGKMLQDSARPTIAISSLRSNGLGRYS